MFKISQRLLLFACLIWPRPSYTNTDKVALLAGTLKTMQRAACDDKIVSLACPRGTSISIQEAQYGKADNCADDGTQSHGVAVEVVGENVCLWPNALQYSLLQTVVQACHKKPQCKFSTKYKPGFVDPCPLARKFVEVTYKCRPYKFRSRTGCENEVITVSCNPHSRIAVYDALYGRTSYDSNKCPQTNGMSDDTCSALFAMETVKQLCHGKRRCQVNADRSTFGTAPCQPDTRIYLKIVYACVPMGVLTEKYESAAENDEIMNSRSEYDKDENFFDETGEADEKWGEIIPPIINSAGSSIHDEAIDTKNWARNIAKQPNPGIVSPVPVLTADEPKIDVTIIEHDNKDTDKNFINSSDSSSILIYIVTTVFILLLLIFILIGVRYLIVRRKKNDAKSNDMFTTDTPNIFGDGLSDIDNDVDVSHISGTFYDPVHPDMILYKDIPGNSTLRAMRPLSTVYPCVGTSMYGNVDYVPSQTRELAVNRFKDNKAIDNDVVMSPKSLRGYSGSQYFYG